jgi:hypothetical protein
MWGGLEFIDRAAFPSCWLVIEGDSLADKTSFVREFIHKTRSQYDRVVCVSKNDYFLEPGDYLFSELDPKCRRVLDFKRKYTHHHVLFVYDEIDPLVADQRFLEKFMLNAGHEGYTCVFTTSNPGALTIFSRGSVDYVVALQNTSWTKVQNLRKAFHGAKASPRDFFTFFQEGVTHRRAALVRDRRTDQIFAYSATIEEDLKEQEEEPLAKLLQKHSARLRSDPERYAQFSLLVVSALAEELEMYLAKLTDTIK